MWLLNAHFSSNDFHLLWLEGANQMQSISRNLISHNEGGGFFFHNVGENNMRLSFESNFVTGCGLRLLNITAPGAVDVYIQNTKLMTLANNYIDDNAGGIFVNTTTRDNQVAIYANITNNVITRNTHAHAFYIEGEDSMLLHMMMMTMMMMMMTTTTTTVTTTTTMMGNLLEVVLWKR